MQNRENNFFPEYYFSIVFSRFNCNIRLSKSQSSLGHGRHHEKKKFFRYESVETDPIMYGTLFTVALVIIC